MVKLGLPNEHLKIPGLSEMSYRQYTQIFLPLNANGGKLEARIANFLKISPTGVIMDKLNWL